MLVGSLFASFNQGILDVLMTNWLGIYIGMKTCSYLQMKEYHWRGLQQISSVRGKVKRSLQQFTPHHYDKFNWATTSSLRNFIAVIALLYLMLQFETNSFYLKSLLYIPISHPANSIRLLLFFFFAMPAVREAYQYLTDPDCKRFGMHAWMAIANIVTELLVIVKFSAGEFEKEMPDIVLYGWLLGIFGLVVFAAWKFGFKRDLRDIADSAKTAEDEISESSTNQRRRSSRLKKAFK